MMITNRYWLAQGGQTTGPFVRTLLLEMWNRGQVAVDAQVCQEGTEDWLDARFLVQELEIERERSARASEDAGRRKAENAIERQRLYRWKEKSRGIAFLLDFLIPGLGYVYCGSLLSGVVMFVFWLILAFMCLAAGVPWALIVVNLLFGAAGAAEARRRNNMLADQLGV